MNDELFNPIDPVEDMSQFERFAEAPRPLVPQRRILKFKISDERDNSQG